MKNNLMICLLVISTLFHVSCEGDKGDPGPKGDPGNSGENGLNGIDGENGNTSSFYFQNGYKGYDGTEDISITNNPDAFATPPTADGLTLYALTHENFDDPAKKDSAVSVVKFEGLKEFIEEEYGRNVCAEEFYVNNAILYLNGVFATNSLESFIQVGLMGDDTPVFSEATATWEKASSTNSWTKKGAEEQWAFNDPILASLGIVNSGFLHNLEASSEIRTMNHRPFYIPGEAIKKWLCEEDSNNALRLSIFGNDATVFFYSSEGPEQEMRPMLYINLDKPQDIGSRSGNSRSFEAWDNLSYEEKMEPLFRIYPELRMN